MLKLTTQQKSEFANAVRVARQSPLLAIIDDVYVRFESERAVRKPICRQSGACCRFEQYGHRLFVTVMEMARFVAGDLSKPEGGHWDGTGCPYQVGGLCSVHSARPFGCRVYFCDPTSTQWQNELYEQLHREIRELHERAGVPYLYVEWRGALDAVGLLPAERASTRLPIIS